MHNYCMDLKRLFGSESEIIRELQHRLNGLPIHRISSIETQKNPYNDPISALAERGIVLYSHNGVPSFLSWDQIL